MLTLRARVLLWYTSLLAIVVALFGVAVCWNAWRLRLAQVDALLAARAAALADALEPAAEGRFDLALPPGPAAAGDRPALYHVLWDAAGDPIDRSDPGLDVPRPEAAGVRSRAGRRELARRAVAGTWVLVGRGTEDLRAEIRALALGIGLIGLGALGLAFGGGWLLVGRALVPVDRISQTAQAMIEGDVDARIPVAEVETELGQLARALNEAFDRLRASLDRQRRFTADASHELRTPIATISTEVQWALERDRDAAAYRESLETCGRAVARMTTIVERLLLLARANAGVDLVRQENVRVDDLVRRIVSDLTLLAERRRLAISVEAAPVSVSGDPDRLRDAITNVVANAIHYNRDGGRVDVRVDQRNGRARVSVADTGIGIAPEDVTRVFEPFFRADQARSRDAGGAGLGLAVTRAIVSQHRGHVACASEPGRGTTVEIELPATVSSPD